MYYTKLRKNDTSLNKIKKYLPDIFEVSWNDVISDHKSRKLTDARTAIVTYLRDYKHLCQTEIANILNSTQGAVSKLHKKHFELINVDPLYKGRFVHFMAILEY